MLAWADETSILKEIFWCIIDVVFWLSLSTSIFQFSHFLVFVYLNPVPWQLYLMRYLLLTLWSLYLMGIFRTPLFLVVHWRQETRRCRCARNTTGHSCIHLSSFWSITNCSNLLHAPSAFYQRKVSQCSYCIKVDNDS